ncbi:RNase H family protein [Niabella ginsengisoli]|uniref:RNase H family protein n=1 Tax=Niabella ginsengisoli TaxID=522298 RepID=UPI0021D40F24|nr:RNase H family protein [Niabella ginsengisoli]
MAVIEGLKTLKTNSIPVVIYSDSQYVVNAISKGWLRNWIRTDFKGGKKIRTSGFNIISCLKISI